MESFEEKWNKQAHENCRRKLAIANDRIVEFEDIKKEHLSREKKLVKALKFSVILNSKVRPENRDFEETVEMIRAHSRKILEELGYKVEEP